MSGPDKTRTDHMIIWALTVIVVVSKSSLSYSAQFPIPSTMPEIIDIDDLIQFEGLPHSHQEVIRCASRLARAIHHWRKGTAQPEAVLIHHMKQEVVHSILPVRYLTF